MLLTALLALTLTAVDDDVTTLRTRRFALPLMLDPARQAEVARVHLCVSTDQGKNWKQAASVKPDAKELVFTAERDGLYWFAVQVQLQDGKTVPETADLKPLSKVLVDTKNAPQIPMGPSIERDTNMATQERRLADLEKEVAELKVALKQLEKRLAEAEKAR